MVYTGHMKDGAVVFENGRPPEGAKVRVEVVAASGVADPCQQQANSTPPSPDAQQSGAERPAVWDKLLELAGTIEGPTDWAENHDHYIHGAPKRKRP